MKTVPRPERQRASYRYIYIYVLHHPNVQVDRERVSASLAGQSETYIDFFFRRRPRPDGSGRRDTYVPMFMGGLLEIKRVHSRARDLSREKGTKITK